jgi:hypothetical protein
MSGSRRPHRGSALWLWSSDEASRALRSRDLANIFKAYRQLNSLSQERLAQILGYDKTLWVPRTLSPALNWTFTSRACPSVDGGGMGMICHRGVPADLPDAAPCAGLARAPGPI